MAQKRAVIDSVKCDRSPLCPAREACPAGAIEREEAGEPYFINSFCQGCRKCVTECRQGAIKMI